MKIAVIGGYGVFGGRLVQLSRRRWYWIDPPICHR